MRRHMIYINEEHMGDIATEQQARRMIECLQAAGHTNVVYGQGQSPADAEDILRKAWDKCLDIVSQESYS